MKPELSDYVQYRLARARESIEVARLVLDQGHLHDAINRLYYACFYAVSALLLTGGLSSSKHTGIRSLFGHHWIRTGKFPARMGHFYQMLFELRQKSDYADLASFRQEDVEIWHNEASSFVARVSVAVEEEVRNQGE
jgi:uncharacterized protein